MVINTPNDRGQPRRIDDVIRESELRRHPALAAPILFRPTFHLNDYSK